MNMEAQEEFMGSNDLTQMVKGKRTKRQRSSSPHKAAAAVVSSSSSGCGVVEEYGSISSPASSNEVYESTEELEEDMANCLILLAQGDRPRHHHHHHLHVDDKKFSARKFFDVSSTTTTTTKAGFFVYECKTCNRSFPSFQALGGHRASHKKPKSTIEYKKVIMIQPSSMDDHDLDDCQLNKSNLDHHHHHHDSLSLQVSSANKGFLGNNNNNKSKIHECSICGSEFTSGQALGGHMRRHRSANNGNNSNNQVISAINSTSTNIDDQIKPRNILPLDLNLPAPEDDHLHRESKFQLVFSAPALVDCHY